jgi:hypothetical protein
MTISENGQKKRISKRHVATEQLQKLAMTGSPQVLRTYFALLQQAHQAVALVAGSQPNNSRKSDDIKDYTDEELSAMLNRFEKLEQENAKRHVLNRK